MLLEETKHYNLSSLDVEKVPEQIHPGWDRQCVRCGSTCLIFLHESCLFHFGVLGVFVQKHCCDSKFLKEVKKKDVMFIFETSQSEGRAHKLRALVMHQVSV